MTEAGRIQAAFWGVKFDHRKPTVRAVAEMFRKMYGPVRTDEVRQWIASHRDTNGTQTGFIRDTESPRKTSNRDTKRTQSGHPRGRAFVEIDTKTISPRVRVEPVLIDNDFGDREGNVLSVLANDAAERNDGKISTSILDGLRQRLSRALTKYGPDAFLAGLEVALDRGKGAAYAIGCMKRYKPEDGRRSQSLPDDGLAILVSSREGYVRAE